MNNDLSEEWRDKLAAASSWQGFETLLVSRSVDDILAYAFRKVLPVLAPSAIDTVKISFADLQKQWKSEHLVETEAELVEDMIKTNLEIDSQRDGFSTFDVTVGTEASENSKLYWMVRVSYDQFKALCQTKFMQINVVIGTTFRGYRVWRVKYKWGNGAIALAVMGKSIPETTAPEEIEGILMVLGGRITRGSNIEVDAQAIWGAVNELKVMYPDCVFTENASLDLYPEKFTLRMKVTSTEQRVARVREDLLSALARRGLRVYVENDT
jgi:hypothetical protein